MTVLNHIWRYWKWLCVASVTTFIVLFTLTLIVNHFKFAGGDSREQIAQCLDSGGSWDERENGGDGACKIAG